MQIKRDIDDENGSMTVIDRMYRKLKHLLLKKVSKIMIELSHSLSCFLHKRGDVEFKE